VTAAVAFVGIFSETAPVNAAPQLLPAALQTETELTPALEAEVGMSTHPVVLFCQT